MGSSVQRVCTFHQNVTAVGTDKCGENCGENADNQSGIHECNRHRQNTGAQRRFQQMCECFQISVKKNFSGYFDEIFFRVLGWMSYVVG